MTSKFWDEGDQNKAPVVQDPPSGPKLAKTILMTLGAVSLVGLGAAGVYYGIQKKPEWFGIKKDSQVASQDEVKTLVAQVGKIIVLPEGETPTLATVTELDKVKDQPFFAKAKNGDKVLVYAIAKKAFLYRPSEKKIIEVGVVNIPQPTGAVAGQNTQKIDIVSPVPTLSPSATFAPRNTVSLTPTAFPIPTQQ